MRYRIMRGLMLAAAAALAVLAGPAAQAQTKLKVMVFPTWSNLPLFAAQTQGYFARHGLEVEIANTPNSDVLREGLAKVEHQIVHAAVDNAVAQVEVAKVDVAIVMGGDGGLNQLFVQPEIKSYDELRGKTVAVDAPDTAFALLLYKMLDLKGVKKGEYQVKPVGGTPLRLQAMQNDKSLVAAMLNPPFSVRADKEGFRSLGAPIDVIGAYQSGGAWVLRSWGRSNPDTLTKYIQANVEGVRWVLDPANKAAAIALLAERQKLPPEVAARTYDMALGPGGFARDARFDLDGFRNVLKLRAEILGTWGGTPPESDKYLDLSYYQRAMTGL